MPSGDKVITWVYYFAIALMLAALPLSKYMMSVSQFILTGVFIVDGIRKKEVNAFFGNKKPLIIVLLFNFYVVYWILSAVTRKFREFFHRENAPAWVFSSLLLLHVLGLFFTTDMEYALKDLRIKLPILLLPLFLSTTGRIDRKAFPILMYFFFAALLAGTLYSTYLYFMQGATDIRDISPFISHIRFSILIDIGIFAMLYMIVKKTATHGFVRIILSFLVLWLVGFLFLTTSMSGLVLLFMTAAIMILYIMYHKRKSWVKAALTAVLLTFFALLAIYIYGIWKDVYREDPGELENLQRTTAQGNPYWHDTTNLQTENGHYVWIYVATGELREAWNNRSEIDFEGRDRAGQEIKYTLIRFLTSKGLRKDAEGVARLTEAEVDLIEKGVASKVYVDRPGIYVRIYKIIWEFKRYQETRNPTGHSIMQRFEYWKASRNIIQQNWLTGVGTGDLNLEFSREYEKMNSLLEPGFRWRSHNQFMAILVAFGIPGLIWFIITILFPPIRMHKFHDYYYLTFFIIIILSMFWEDTIESQAGVTIYAFFTSFYLFAKKFIDVA